MKYLTAQQVLPELFLNSANVPRKDQRGDVCSQVMHGSSHSQDTFIPL